MTQKEIIKSKILWNQLSIKAIAKETWILEPNIRRILWEWTKKWEFSRIAKWVYKIETENWATWIFKMCDSLKEIWKINEKFDMVFLDIPYKTKAVIWGSRWVKYPLITENEFSNFLIDLKNVLKDSKTPVYYMFSNAPSGLSDMMRYNSHFEKQGFKRVDYWEWSKLFKNWNPATNMRWHIMPPEWIALYTLSWETNEYWDRIMNFTLPKTNTASEKPQEMLKQLIKQSSKEFDLLLDPFAWTWIFWKIALEMKRNVRIFELSWKRFYNEIIKL